jgi:hypothetical protein
VHRKFPLLVSIIGKIEDGENILFLASLLPSTGTIAIRAPLVLRMATVRISGKE